MTLLVADVGGTNTRIALIRPSGPISDMVRCRNADFGSFQEVLSQYFATRDMRDLTGCCIAVAGPVTSGSARMTNLDWSFDTTTIAAALSLSSSGQVHLLNDLAALGFSLSGLSPDQLTEVRPSSGSRPQNGQALVAGVGTGFNVCLVKSTQRGPVVIEAELGHTCLPANVSDSLEKALGPDAAQFITLENLMSGAGLVRLYKLISGGDKRTGRQILESYVPSHKDTAAETVELFARMLGVVARELVFQYLPYGGIHFAGGVARGILDSPAKGVFLKAFEAPGPFAEHLAIVPVRVISDDAAALVGAAYFARAET